MQHRGQFPVDVNTAPKEMLLRVPGFGTRTVDRIIASRRNSRLRHEDLVQIGAQVKKAKAVVSLPGWTPGAMTDSRDLRARFAPPPEQLRLL